jgi:23S rRNA (cytosine1962-C5)-methyltransferase
MDLAVIYDRRDKFLATGLYDPNSPIRVRVVHNGKPRPINRDFWSERLAAACSVREPLFGAETTGYRIVNGENDGFPGLVLDRYANVLVLKLYTPAWFSRLEEMLGLLKEQVGGQAAILRLARNTQAIAAEDFGLSDGQILRGDEVAERIVFRENGLRFNADVLKGQKTGFFLDQRDNRRRVGELAAGRHVLNCFSFSGGFSLYAARCGAASVSDLDISRHALDSAEANFKLNGDIREVADCEHRLIRGNAFDWLGKADESNFDLIVLDPPSMAKKKADRDAAMKAYRQLSFAGVRNLRKDGILVAASCSAHLARDEFYDLVLLAARDSGRRYREIARHSHAPDHSVTFPEGAYLKCIYLQFEG